MEYMSELSGINCIWVIRNKWSWKT